MIILEDYGILNDKNDQIESLYKKQVTNQRVKTLTACRLAESMLQYLIDNDAIQLDTAVKYRTKLQELKS